MTSACSRSLSIALAVAVLGAEGCTHERVRYPDPAPQWYAVEFESERRNTGGQLGNESTPLVKDARDVLRRGRTVAFLPPDSCRTLSVAPNGATQAGSTIRMECGSLLAGLEAEAARIGYTVVSWQALKVGQAAAASITAARELGVEVLFEINELTEPTRRDSGQQEEMKTNFFRDAALNPTAPRWEPVAILPDTAERCLADNLNPGQDWISTVNLKATEVSRGRAVWLYQHSVVEHVGEGDRVEKRLLRFVDRGENPPPPEVSDDYALAWMALPAALGIWLVWLMSELESGTMTGEKAGFGAILAVSGGACIGAVGNGLGWLLTMPDKRPPVVRYKPADSVICSPDHLYREKSTATAEIGPATSSSFTRRVQTNSGQNAEDARAARLRKATTEEFARALLAIAEGKAP